MHVTTLFVTIGLAYGVLAVLLLVSERPRLGTPSALLAVGYGLGSVGVLLQAGRATVAVGVSVLLGNLLAWLGLQWQAWAALAMSGRPTTLRLRLGVAATTVACGIPVALLPAAPRASISLLVYAACFALAAWALFTWRDAAHALRDTTAVILAALATMYALRSLAVAAGFTGPNALVAEAQPVSIAFYSVAFAAVVSSAFGLILLGKRAAERSLADALRQTETILGTLTTGVAIVDDERIVRANAALAAMLDCLPADLEGQSIAVLFPTDEAAQAWQREMSRSLVRDGRHAGAVELARRGGGARWTWTQVAVLDWQDGRQRQVVTLTDISDLKALQEELADRAATDDLTGLVNRRSFLERANVELSRAARTGRPLCIAVLDLDRLKTINDEHGHSAGDQALVSLARAASGAVRDLDVVARLGGDEFVIVLSDSTLAQADEIMERVLSTLQASPVVIDGASIPVSASIGVAAYMGSEPLEAILARADQAMYAAKTQGRGSIARKAAL